MSMSPTLKPPLLTAARSLTDGSLTTGLVKVMLPVFWTVIAYEITSPAAFTVPPGTEAVLSSTTCGFCAIGTDAESLSFASGSAAPWSVVTDAVLL